MAQPRIPFIEDLPVAKPDLVDPVFIVEWRGKLFTPFGSVKHLAWQRYQAETVALEPSGEGLFDCIYDEGGKSVSFLEVTQSTPTERVVKFTPAALLMEGVARASWPVGLTMILGPAGTGKSLLAPHLSRTLNGAAVSIGEPGPGMRPFSAPAYSTVLTAALTGTETITVVDSLRMATLGGSQLGPGGIPRDMGTQLSQIDYAARLYGKAIFGVVNLLTSDARANESAYEVISGSCSAVLRTENTRITEELFQVTGDATIRPTDRENTAYVLNIKRTK